MDRVPEDEEDDSIRDAIPSTMSDTVLSDNSGGDCLLCGQ